MAPKIITITSSKIIRVAADANGSYPAIATKGPPNQISKAKHKKPIMVIVHLDLSVSTIPLPIDFKDIDAIPLCHTKTISRFRFDDLTRGSVHCRSPHGAQTHHDLRATSGHLAMRY
jgi:hypothetical protein